MTIEEARIQLEVADHNIATIKRESEAAIGYGTQRYLMEILSEQLKMKREAIDFIEEFESKKVA